MLDLKREEEFAEVRKGPEMKTGRMPWIHLKKKRKKVLSVWLGHKMPS